MRDLKKFIAECEKDATPDAEINLSDIPEMTDEEAKELYPANWKPVKKAISTRIDADNLEWLKGDNPKGYQRRLNNVIRWARYNGYQI